MLSYIQKKTLIPYPFLVIVSLDVQCCCFIETLWDQTLMVQVAKRGASVLKRRKSRNRMEPPNRETPNTPQDSAPPPRSESDGDVVFYTEEPRSGNYFVLLF